MGEQQALPATSRRCSNATFRRGARSVAEGEFILPVARGYGGLPPLEIEYSYVGVNTDNREESNQKVELIAPLLGVEARINQRGRPFEGKEE